MKQDLCCVQSVYTTVSACIHRHMIGGIFPGSLHCNLFIELLLLGLHDEETQIPSLGKYLVFVLQHHHDSIHQFKFLCTEYKQFTAVLNGIAVTMVTEPLLRHGPTI